MADHSTTPRYVEPGWFTNHVFNPAVALLTRMGISVWGSRELRVGKRTDRFRATEVADADKVPILRAYLKRWKAEVGVFFDGVSGDSPDADLQRIAPDHPVFRVDTVAKENTAATPTANTAATGSTVATAAQP